MIVCMYITDFREGDSKQCILRKKKYQAFTTLLHVEWLQLDYEMHELFRTVNISDAYFPK